MNIKKTAIAVLCAVLLFVSGAVPNAFADWYDDISSGEWVEIKGKNFVADTFHGVKALYNEGGPTLYCNELVIRFYKEAYGLDVSAGKGGISMKTEGYKFVTPKTPKPGDVVYVTAEMRGGTSDHWAIVKYNRGDRLVLFEQNVTSGGKAGIERTLKYPSNSYLLYTPVSTGEKPDPVLKGSSAKPQTTEKTTEKTTVTTTEKTTVTTTQKPTTTTTKPTTTTTKPTTTTTKPTTTTTKPTTTKPVTTTKITTTIPSTAASTTTVTSTAQTALSATETQTFAVTFLSIEITENYSSVMQEYSSEAVEEKNSSHTGKIVIGAVCAALVMGIAALVVLIIKKK